MAGVVPLKADYIQVSGFLCQRVSRVNYLVAIF